LEKLEHAGMAIIPDIYSNVLPGYKKQWLSRFDKLLGHGRPLTKDASAKVQDLIKKQG